MTVINPGIRGQLVKIAEGNIGSPRISGDGSTVVWNQLVDGQLEVFRYKDGQTQCLSKDPRPDMHADVSYDGDTVVWTRFSKEDPRDPTGSWDVVMWKNGNVSTVAADPVANEMTCRVSRDGKAVAYDSDMDGSMGRWRIEKWQDGQAEAVTSGAPGTSQEFPILSGDGKRIFWREYASGNSDIWMRDQTGCIKPVVTQASEQVTPQVSPDGCILVWTDDRNGDDDVFLTDIDHGNQVKVIAGSRDMDETWASVSADGNTIAWTCFDRRDQDTSVNVYMRTGDNVQQVTMDINGMNSWPSVSDDGQRILWQWQDREDYRNSALYMLVREEEKSAS